MAAPWKTVAMGALFPLLLDEPVALALARDADCDAVWLSDWTWELALSLALDTLADALCERLLALSLPTEVMLPAELDAEFEAAPAALVTVVACPLASVVTIAAAAPAAGVAESW